VSSEEPPGEPPEQVQHQDDGLDLAKALTRATAKSSPAARRKQRSKDVPRRGRVSGAHPDDRDPQLLDTTLGRLVADHGWALDLRVHGVFGRWEELVGAEVARHCTPESFADGRLVVRTDSTAWATQLRLLAPTVVRRLNEELGHGTVTAIDVQGPHLPTWKKGPRSVRDGRGPRDTYG
jgi:predicted nucleic acid-binding Zn ribbon protein